MRSLLTAALVMIALGQTPSTVHTRRGSSNTLPLSKFYDTPHPLPPGKPGELIRSEPADDYYLSADFSAVRILYHSRSASGQDVAASGVVLMPVGKPPSGGWPVIAWAHSFSGVGRQCAPSLVRNLDSGSFLSMYLNLGYAVVATDYTGLGTDFRSAGLDVPSNATDVVYAAAAARKAAPQLGERWLAMGTALGANVAIGVAELEAQLRDPGYLGAVAISGVADLRDMYERLPKEGSFGMLQVLAYGTKTVFPEYNVGSMLTDKAMASYEHTKESCSAGTGAADGDMVKADWKNDKFVDHFFDRNALGRRRVYGPLLVISDDADPAAPAAGTAQVVARLCKQGARVQFNKFADTQPGMVIGDSVRDQMAWIEARFAGKTAPSNCP